MKPIEEGCEVVVVGGDCEYVGKNGYVSRRVLKDDLFHGDWIADADGWIVEFGWGVGMYEEKYLRRIDDYEEPETQKEEELLEA